MSDPLISVYCITFNRPKLLARTIACFEAQSWKSKEMIILCDQGQYAQPQRGEQWEIISFDRKIQSLGEKNNVAISMCKSDLIARADDDDSYGVHWLESLADVFMRHPEAGIIQPQVAIDYIDGHWVQVRTHAKGTDSRCTPIAYHGGFAYRRSWIVNKMRGYAAEYAGDDVELDRRRREIRERAYDIDRAKFGPQYRYWSSYYKAHPEALGGAPVNISRRGGSREVYMSTPRGPYVGKLKPYRGDEVWNMPIPTNKPLPRPW